MASNSVMIHRLQRAINDKFDDTILYNKTQWYSQDAKRPVTTYVIRRAYWDEEKHKTKSIELFQSTSQIQIVLFLRDYWYLQNGWSIPTDNEKWTEIKKQNNLTWLLPEQDNTQNNNQPTASE